MNATKHTPWSCRLVRFGASLSRDGDAASWVRRHADACPSCQQHFATAASFEQQLRASAPSRSVAPRASLEHDIMREIMAAAPDRASAWSRDVPSRSSRPRRVWPAFALAASAACAVALVFVQRPRHGNPPPSPAPRVESVVSATTPSSASWTQLATPVRTLLNEDPLQSEAQQVVAEARSAVDFLALNFLPNPPGPETDPSL